MGFLQDLLGYLVPFLILLTVLVFVHEMGHYLVARWNRVRIDVFSIGFGPEIFGWNDRSGTRWKVSWVPLGGYVKFFGDTNAASAPDGQTLDSLAPEERQVAFHHKRLWQRAAIVAAGPVANFVYAIVVLALLFGFYGQRVTPPEVGRIAEGSPAAAAGFEEGDVILSVEGEDVRRFEQVEQLVLMNPGRELEFVVLRDGERIRLAAVPELRKLEDDHGIVHDFGDLGLYASNPAEVGKLLPGMPAEQAGFRPGDLIVAVDGRPVDSFEQLQDMIARVGGRSLQVEVVRDGERVTLQVAAEREAQTLPSGERVERWLIGIQRAPQPLVRHGPATALAEAARTSAVMIVRTVEYVGQMIAGNRGTEELGGPLRIAQVSGQAAQVGIEQLVMLSVLLSLNLGLINLFPIPVLDGGHLLFYAFEAVRGRPLTERMQEYAFRIGLAMILTLTVFATWNDLVNLRVFDFISGLFS